MLNRIEYPTWRWDQGRLNYLRFDNVRSQARALLTLDGLNLSEEQATLERSLIDATGLSYGAGPNALWRNYGRTFKTALIAEDVNGALAPTQIARLLASNSSDALIVDDYISLFAGRFRLPFPGYIDFDVNQVTVWPVLSVLKAILSKGLLDKRYWLDAQRVGRLIIGNALTGLEPLEFYRDLEETDLQLDDRRIRQIRELLAFVSQMSWLHWERSTLKLASAVSPDFCRQVVAQISPYSCSSVEKDRALTNLLNDDLQILNAPSPDDDSDATRFLEGNRQMRTHLRIERSKRLIDLYLSKMNGTASCDICRLVPKETYAWVSDFFDVHHLLPLGSPIDRHPSGTSLSELRALCPNCHRAVHIYYKHFLTRNGIQDFRSKEEAFSAYHEVKQRVKPYDHA